MSDSTQTAAQAPQKVIVTGFNMPFGELVVFMVKFAIATIPAALILLVLVAIFGGAIGGLSR